MEKTLYFYGTLLNLPSLPSVDMGDHLLRYFQLPDGGKIELTEYYFDTPEISTDAMNKGSARHLAFETDDINALEKTLTEAGYCFHVPVSYVEKLGFAGGLLNDPNGFELEFLKYGKHR